MTFVFVLVSRVIIVDNVVAAFVAAAFEYITFFIANGVLSLN